MSQQGIAFALRKLGLQFDLPYTGDIKATRPLTVGAAAVKVHQIHAPFVNYGAVYERCSGSVLARVDRTTVALPCFSCEVVAGGSVCAHCEQVWNSGPDADGFFMLDKKSMKAAVEYYKPGAGNNFFRLPAWRVADDAFSAEISIIKQLFDGTDMELEAEWPGCHFKQVVESTVVEAGVVHDDSGKKTNPYKRLAIEQQRLGDYMTQMVKLWLRVRAYVSLGDLLTQTKILSDIARVVEAAMRSSVQATRPKVPAYCGAISAADIMLAGFSHAAKAFDQIVAATVSPETNLADIPEFWWGPQVEEFKTWAMAVSLIQTPPKQKLPSKTSTPAQSAQKRRNSPFSPAGSKQFFAVAVGRVPGVYASMAEVRKQTEGLSDGKMKIFATEADAEQYVQRYRRVATGEAPASASKSATLRSLFVAVGGSRPGIYEHEAVARFYAAKKNGTVTRVESVAEGRKLLKKPAPPYYRESVVPSTNVIDLSDNVETSPDGKFFVVFGGKNPGVYISEMEAFDTVTIHGGVFKSYATKQLAEQAYQAAQEREISATAQTTTPPLPSIAFVVWAGRSVGVMSREACMRATMNLEGVRMKGPMSAQDAFGLWLEKESVALVLEDKANKKPKLDTPPAQAMPPCAAGGAPSVDMPSDAQLERAEQLGVTRVFACKVSDARVRIALSYEQAKNGVEKPDVKSFFQKPTLIENITEAEVWAERSNRKPKATKSFKERYAEARKKRFQEAAKEDFPDSDPLGYCALRTPEKRPADTEATPGQPQLGVGFLGFKGMVRSRRVLQMQRCFIDCATAIRIDTTGQPDPYELDEDSMELPGSSTYMLSSARTGGPLKIEEWFEERKNSIKAWPLMSFSEFLSFCRHAIRLCSKSSKPAAAVNCAALNELTDIAIRLHRHMDRLGTLGSGESRFMSRMYLHLQFATMKRVVHTSAAAMAVFKEATEVFMTRLPKNAFSSSTETASGAARAAKAEHDKHNRSPSKSGSGWGKPKSGCYLCAATDHYCSDRSKHPLTQDGKHKKVSPDTQKAIMQRIDNSTASVEWKAAEKKRVREFWARRCAQ